MTETLIKDSIYKVLTLFKPYGWVFEVCQTQGKYISRLIFIIVTNFQAKPVLQKSSSPIFMEQITLHQGNQIQTKMAYSARMQKYGEATSMLVTDVGDEITW